MPLYDSQHIISVGHQKIKPAIRDINLAKMGASPPTLTREQLSTMEDDAVYIKIMRMIDLGDLTRTRELVVALDNTYYTNGEKDQIVAIIDANNL